MGLSVCVLGSGSAGNSTFVGSSKTCLLIDAGISCKQIELRLKQIEVGLGAIDGVCVTHEHRDHTGALGVMHRKTGVALYGNTGTIDGIEEDASLRGLPWNVFSPGSPFVIGDIGIEPFLVSHDSYEPVGFVLSNGDARVGIVTDMGVATELVKHRLRRCQVVLLESNHDEEMLRESERPWSLKQRISGRQGHLSNEQAGEVVRDIASPELQAVYLVHLSSQCNTAGAARRAVRERLDKAGLQSVAVEMTYPDRISRLIEL